MSDPLLPPVPTCTRKYFPGSTEPERANGEFALKNPAPLALAYCSDHPVRFTVVEPRLNSSTNFCLYAAPVLAAPAYTWLITIDVETTSAVPAPIATSSRGA